MGTYRNVSESDGKSFLYFRGTCRRYFPIQYLFVLTRPWQVPTARQGAFRRAPSSSQQRPANATNEGDQKGDHERASQDATEKGPGVGAGTALGGQHIAVVI